MSGGDERVTARCPEHAITVCEPCGWVSPRAAREALEKVARVEALFAGGPDTPCRTRWRGEGVWSVECVEVPLDELRAALGTESTWP